MKRRKHRQFTSVSLIGFFGLLLFLIATPIEAEQAATVYRGNTGSRVFHRPGCRYYNCSKCTAEFTTRQSAVEAGYRPCKVCKP